MTFCDSHNIKSVILMYIDFSDKLKIVALLKQFKSLGHYGKKYNAKNEHKPSSIIFKFLKLFLNKFFGCHVWHNEIAVSYEF